MTGKFVKKEEASSSSEGQNFLEDATLLISPFLDTWSIIYSKYSVCDSRERGKMKPDAKIFDFQEQSTLTRNSTHNSTNIEEDLKPRGLCGLNNMGNTCYMNSAIQSLSNCVPLTQFFLKCDAFITGPETGKPSVAVEYCKLMRILWGYERQRSINPSALARSIRMIYTQFKWYAQQDSQEFLRCIMDRLHDELKRPEMNFHLKRSQTSPRKGHIKHESKKLLGGQLAEVEQAMDVDDQSDDEYSELGEKHQDNNKSKENTVVYHSIITDVFNGKLKSLVQCLACSRVSTTIENFQDLSLPIPGKDDLMQIHSQRSPHPISCSSSFYAQGWFSSIYSWLESWFVGPQVSLQDCLAAFFAKDELKGDNMYNCEKCNKLRNGVKYLKVLSLPEVLCIHLKRFRHEMHYSSKINYHVNFPVNGLDMRPFLDKDWHSEFTTYDLCAVITHFGNVGGGHYIAYAKNCINGKWYEFNDSLISEVSEYVVESTEAYVLFYSKRSSADQTFRAHVREAIEKMSNTDPCQARYISREWFNRFETCAEPGQISNFDFLCRHGGVPPSLFSRVKSMVIDIPLEIWNTLSLRYGGGPEVRKLSECNECKDLQRRREKELECFSKLHDAYQNNPDEKAAYVLSITWYKRWHAFAKGDEQEPPGSIDNTSILELKGTAYYLLEDSDYGLISSETWQFFQSTYGGGPEFVIENKPTMSNKSTSEEKENTN